MSRDRLPQRQRHCALQCVRAALTQGFALDALLLLGLFITALSDRSGWTTAYTVVISTGVGKTVVAGCAAAFRCWALTRAARRSDLD